MIIFGTVSFRVSPAGFDRAPTLRETIEHAHTAADVESRNQYSTGVAPDIHRHVEL